MATVQEQAQVNLGVGNANLLVTRLTTSYIIWSDRGSGGYGTKVSAKITREFASLVSKNLNPLYSSSVPIYQTATTLGNFSVVKGVISGKNVKNIQVGSLSSWNAQYVAWSIQLPTILQVSGISGDKSQIIISEFSSWYTTNIAPLIPKVSITGVR